MHLKALSDESAFMSSTDEMLNQNKGLRLLDKRPKPNFRLCVNITKLHSKKNETLLQNFLE